MSIIDRAARALLKAQSGTDDWDGLDAELQDTLREEARAVLRAIREPTTAMINTDPGVLGVPIYAEDIWKAMIDAALEEK